MAFSNTWDATYEGQPADSEDLSLGASRTRDHKEAIRERLSLIADTDTDGSGTWQFLPEQGNLAARNALEGGTPTAGTFFYRTDLEIWQRYDGADWVSVGRIVNEIRLWAGNPTAVPDGWALCDGSTVNSILTPDLAGRFIVGFDAGDSDYDTVTPIAAPDTGGAKTHTLDLTEIPAHDHGGATSSELADGAGISVAGGSGPIPIPDLSGGHTHTITSAGGGAAHENRPPYYTLAYIMYVGGE